MSESKRSGWKICAKCGGSKNLDNHHIIPQAYYKREYGEEANDRSNKMRVTLCCDCHGEIGRILDKYPNLQEIGFMKITLKFLEGAFNEKLQKLPLSDSSKENRRRRRRKDKMVLRNSF